MAKNLHPGPAWVPAVIEHKLGPLCFLVKTKDGQMWRHHVNHLKKVHSAQASVDGEENSITQPLTVGNYPVLNTLIFKLQSQVMPRRTWALLLRMLLQMNCQTLPRQSRPKPLQMIVFTITQPEFIILLF